MVLRNYDVGDVTGWQIVYFQATPEFEAMHPASAMNQASHAPAINTAHRNVFMRLIIILRLASS